PTCCGWRGRTGFSWWPTTPGCGTWSTRCCARRCWSATARHWNWRRLGRRALGLRFAPGAMLRARNASRTASHSRHRPTVEQPVQLIDEPVEILLLFLRQVVEQADDPTHAQRLVRRQGLFAGLGEADVDLAFVA